MDNFIFKKVNNRKFRWESSFMVLEFSNPSIQGFSDYIKLKDEKEIMHYYYTIKIFKKIPYWNDDENEVTKLTLVSKRDSYDFPTISQLKWILDYQLKDNPIIDGQKIKYESGDIRYSKQMATEGFGCDDFYEITKSVNSKGEDEDYIVYCGTTFDIQGDLNSSGIRIQSASRKDIEELFKCVSEFIQYSLDKHNKENMNWKNRFEIKYNKIYEYYADYNKLDKNKVESIYAIGDILNITTVVNNKQEEYSKVSISKIEGKNIILNNGDIIDFNTIVYINNEIVEEKLKYKENKIAQDFLNILSDEEKAEFKNCSVKVLLSKYKMAIVNRTWMCIDEHEFNMDYTGDRVENVTPIVENVINIITSVLK